MASTHLFFLGLISLSFFLFACVATDNNNLLDFCVADANSPVIVNGAPCKDPNVVQADDFFFAGLGRPGNSANPMGSRVTPAYAKQIPGLNTLGLSMARIDYAPDGLNPPHTHPRASEIMTVIEGTLEVGFISSKPEYRHFTKILNRGDTFVFPLGLLHYQRNVGSGIAAVVSALNSQNPGTTAVSTALFTSKPAVNDDVICKSFLVDKQRVASIRSKFNP